MNKKNDEAILESTQLGPGVPDIKPDFKVRKIMGMNGTCYVALPKEFVEQNRLKPGDKLICMFGANCKFLPISDN